MTELTFPILRHAFRTQSLTEKDYLSFEELYNVISKLNISEFDEETFEEIWDQCKLNSKGEVRLSDFIEVLMKGETLLVEKQIENKNEILRIETEKKGKVADFADQHQFKEQMDALLEEKIGVANSLEIIRKPFIASTENINKTAFPHSQIDAANPERREVIDQNDVIAQLFEYDSSETASSLTTIFYLAVVLMGLSWLSSLFICQFVNIVVYLAILSQFAFQIISRKLVKFNLLLLAGATFLDLLWLIIQTGNVWYPPSNYELSGNTSTYLKFSVMMIIAGFCLRLILIYFYLTQFHMDEYQIYIVKILGKELNIQREAEPYTPNKNPLSLMLEPFFNKAVEEEQLPQ